MKYIIGVILLVIALFIAGLIWRKKVYDAVDRLENWKMDITNRPVTEELSKVKNLNLSGETQEKFEAWREQWDTIITKELTAIEKDLYEAEEAADRYKWKRVQKVLDSTEDKLVAIENDIQKILEELKNLLDSEENSRIEIESIGPEIKELSRKLIQHRNQFGQSASLFEKRVEQLELQLGTYEELAEQGNYIEANKLVQSIREELLSLQEETETFPERYKKVNLELPEQLRELKQGIEEMKAEGYRVAHLDLLPEIHRYERILTEALARLNENDQTDIEELIVEVETRIQEIYQMLEREAVAHQYVEKQYAPLRSQLDNLEAVFMETEEDMEEIDVSYQMQGEEAESYEGLKSWFSQLKKKFISLEHKRQDGESAYSELRLELEEARQNLMELQEKHQEFDEKVQALRREEMDAKTKLSDMEQLLLETYRRLKRSNIPGIPSSIYEDMKIASDKIDEVFACLEREPLDMAAVHNHLNDASDMTQDIYDEAQKIMDRARLAERVIQYANRYRSKYPILAARLLEAENKFRSYQYESALELASEALKEVDPDAFSRIEEKEQVMV
ncbi:septation ring formation regulator [Halobacillus alkaliphilus]|uniref:Septation ring formation regulator EzrA n=1 Tax=Halobacillus alkaliphilus TaxID=396056 RepID=A0A1I2SMV2_9BACI|nr:septation ring formation regulator EzrA [Halobacillus alkaliphilus]SFG52237.1 septation ring formation regulator [Halobacillus alkaliphilus]